MAVNGSWYQRDGRLSSYSDNRANTCRIVVLGCSGVGKTALTVRYLTKRFIGEYCPTLESIYKCHENIDDEEARLEILDTAGQDNDYWKEGYAYWGDCFLLVYSITDRTSFTELTNIKRQLDNARGATYLPMMIVANKGDLLHDRQVKEHEGVDLGRAISCKHLEVSAADWTHIPNITEMFHELYREFSRKRYPRDGRLRKPSQSKFKQAIQKVISGKGTTVKREIIKSDQKL